MKKKAAPARRQRVPAFGEWNYAAYVDGAGDWPITHYLESAGVHAAGRLVVAIPPSPPLKPANKVVKWKESATPTLELDDEDEDEDEKQRQQHVVVGLDLGEHGGAVKKKQGRKQQQSPAPVVAHHARVHASSACNYKAGKVVAAAVAVKAMDQDLYHIPPDMLCHEPRKRVTRRSLWIWGCLGLNCVA